MNNKHTLITKKNSKKLETTFQELGTKARPILYYIGVYFDLFFTPNNIV